MPLYTLRTVYDNASDECCSLSSFLETVRFPLRIKAKHFHLICLLPFDNDTKIEKFSIHWGIVAANFSQNQLKIKIDTQFCFQYFAIVLFLAIQILFLRLYVLIFHFEKPVFRAGIEVF